MVKTPPFHGGFMGSNPIRVTMVIQLLIKSFYIDLRMLFKVQIKNLDFKKHFFIVENKPKIFGSIINVGVRENSLASTFIFLQKKKHKYILFG